MDQRTIPEDLRFLYQECATMTPEDVGRYGTHLTCEVGKELIERLALAESQAAELREEVERLKSYQGNYEHATQIERGEKDEIITTLREQLAEWLKQNAPSGWIDDLRKTVERQQRAVTDQVMEIKLLWTALASAVSMERLNALSAAVLASRSREQEPTTENKGATP